MFFNTQFLNRLNTFQNPSSMEKQHSSYKEEIKITPFEYLNTLIFYLDSQHFKTVKEEKYFLFNINKQIKNIEFNFIEDNENEIDFKLLYNIFIKSKVLINIINCKINLNNIRKGHLNPFFNNKFQKEKIMELTRSLKLNETSCYNLLFSYKLKIEEINNILSFSSYENIIINNNIKHISKDKILFKILHLFANEGQYFKINGESNLLLLRKYSLKTGIEINYNRMPKIIFKEIINNTRSFKSVSKIITKYLNENKTRLYELLYFFFDRNFIFHFSSKTNFFYQWNFLIRLFVKIDPFIFVKFYNEVFDNYVVYDQNQHYKINIIFYFFMKNLFIKEDTNDEVINLYNEIKNKGLNESNIYTLSLNTKTIVFTNIKINVNKLKTTNSFLPIDEPSCRCCMDDLNDDKEFLVLTCNHLICLECAKLLRDKRCTICRKEINSKDDISLYKD
jgi:hypothetical protein